MKIQTTFALIAAFGIGIASGPAAQADELVSNGDFSLPDLAGWTLSGDTAAVSVLANSDIDFTAAGYSFIAGTSGIGQSATLEQTLNTIAGLDYDLTFELNQVSSSFISIGDFFNVTMGGQTLLALSSPSDAVEVTHATIGLLYTATGSSTPLAFNFMNENSFFYLSNVSVSTAPAAVPLPQAWSLMLAGLLPFGKKLRGRR